MRIEFEEDDKVDVPMSPLIDCVFLLLIFFLVTTMMKKWEMQIPLSLPSMTSTLSRTQSGTEAEILSVDEKGRVFRVVNQDAFTGTANYVLIKDLSTFLDNLEKTKGKDIAVEVTAHRAVPVKTVIDVFDKCQVQGFTKTRVRLGGKPYAAN